MIDEEEEWKQNLLTDLENLNDLVNFDDSTIKTIADYFNQHGANTSYKKIAELTGFDVGTDAIRIRDSLVSLIHFYKKHHELVEEVIKENIESIDKTINKFRFIVNNLNDKGIKGMEILYQIIENDERPTLSNIEHKLLLTEIMDDDDISIGYVPIVRLSLGVIDEDEDEITQTIFLSLDNFNAFVESLKDIQYKVTKKAKDYHNLVGDSILVGEE